MELGEKISSLRKSNGMTQAELGEKLGVTYQAVSKWERNESLPDFDMMLKLSKLYGVSIAYFEEENSADTDSTEQAQSTDEQKQNFDDIVGFCNNCGKLVRVGEEAENSSKILCKQCDEQLRKEAEQKREAAKKAAEEKQRQLEEQRIHDEILMQAPFKKRTKIACIVAGILCVCWLALSITIGCLSKEPINWGIHILGAIVLTLLIFTFVFQLFWDGWVRRITLAGAISLRLPGIIFTMDLDGLIFLVVMKVLLWILSGLVAIVGFLITATLALIVSPFTFIPHIFKIKRFDDDIL